MQIKYKAFYKWFLFYGFISNVFLISFISYSYGQTPFLRPTKKPLSSPQNLNDHRHSHFPSQKHRAHAESSQALLNGNGSLPNRDSAGGSLPGRGGESGRGGGGGLPDRGSSPRLRIKKMKPEVAMYSNGAAPGIEEYQRLGYCTGKPIFPFTNKNYNPGQNKMAKNKVVREYHLLVTSAKNTAQFSPQEHRTEPFMKITMANERGEELTHCGNLSHVEKGTDLAQRGRAINAPPLFFYEGETAKIVVHNRSRSAMTIHWHGIFLETQMDGIPGFQPPIKPNQTFIYNFDLNQNGTYWYHPHDLNEQDTRGAIIIFSAPKGHTLTAPNGEQHISPGEWITYQSPKSKYNTSYNRDRMIMMSDYKNRSPLDTISLLKNDQDVYTFDSGYSRGFLEQPHCAKEYWENFKAMKMFWMDPADVWYDYFLLNDETCLNCGPWKDKLEAVREEFPGQNFPVLKEFSEFQEGDRIRLRLINSSASSFFHVNYGNSQEIADPKQKLDMLIVAKDGQAVEPIYTDSLYMGMGETYDVIIDVPNAQTLYELKIKSIDDYDPVKDNNGRIIKETRRTARVLIGDGKANKNGMVQKDRVKIVPAYEQSVTLCGPQADESDTHSEVSYEQMKRRAPPPADTGMPSFIDPISLPEYTGHHVFQKLKLFGNMEDYYWQIQPDNDDLAKGQKKLKFQHFPMGNTDMPYIEVANSQYNFIQIKNTMMEGMMNHPWHLHGLYFKLLDKKDLLLNQDRLNQLLQARPLLHTATIKPGETKVIAFYAANEFRGAWMFHCHNLYHMASDMMMFVKYDNFNLEELSASQLHGHGHKHGTIRDSKNQTSHIQDFILESLGMKNGFITGEISALGGVNPSSGNPLAEIDANIKTRLDCKKGGQCFAEIVTGLSRQNLNNGEMSFYGNARLCSGKKCATLHYSYDTKTRGENHHKMLGGISMRPFNSDFVVLNGAVGAICSSNSNSYESNSKNKCQPAGDFSGSLQITNGKIGAFNQLIPQSRTVYRGNLSMGCEGELCKNIYGQAGAEALINRNVKLVGFCRISSEKEETQCLAGISILLDPIYHFGEVH